MVNWQTHGYDDVGSGYLKIFAQGLDLDNLSSILDVTQNAMDSLFFPPHPPRIELFKHLPSCTLFLLLVATRMVVP